MQIFKKCLHFHSLNNLKGYNLFINAFIQQEIIIYFCNFLIFTESSSNNFLRIQVLGRIFPIYLLNFL